MFFDWWQHIYELLLKQTVPATSPSVTVGWLLLNQPGNDVPHLSGSGHSVGIVIPGMSRKRYQSGLRFWSHSVFPGHGGLRLYQHRTERCWVGIHQLNGRKSNKLNLQCCRFVNFERIKHLVSYKKIKFSYWSLFSYMLIWYFPSGTKKNSPQPIAPVTC